MAYARRTRRRKTGGTRCRPEGGRVLAHRLLISGRVQGVGFRPFVYRLARRLGLSGTVRNALGQVEILVQGPDAVIQAFARQLITDAPPLARAQLRAHQELALAGRFCDFRILASEAHGAAEIHVPPDEFMCEDCRAELDDPADRRFRYPFINCTQCGPRYTLIERMPYDRPNTTMSDFAMCGACRAEYSDPANRRYHAEPIACPDCGPQLTLRTAAGEARARGEPALRAAIEALRGGQIVAAKGIGGYHLMVDATNQEAVERLRRRKHRPRKPLAVLYPRRGPDGLARLRRDALPEPVECAALRSPARPIVLVRLRHAHTLAAGVAPGLSEVGAFLAYSPVHHLLLEDFDGPLVATSGNLSGEPVLSDETAAHRHLGNIADLFLDHDRRITRPADDPVLRRSCGVMRAIRIGRGTGPLELELPVAVAQPVLAVGAHLKNCVAIAQGRRLILSPHIGTLGAPRSVAVFERVIADLQALHEVRAQAVVCDAHPDYQSTRWARRSGLPVLEVWHHHAHASALAVEHPGEEPMLVFTWDGVGLGEDGTLWGGEALFGRPGQWRRVASWRPFRLPGGDIVAKEPWRSAASLCFEAGLEWSAAPPEVRILRDVWQRPRFSPSSSAVGRLFDAAAALVLGVHASSYEAEAPMRLEGASDPRVQGEAVPLAADAHGVLRADWAALLPALLDARRPAAERGGFFHDSLARTLIAIAERIGTTQRVARIGLAGGVFQNRLLTEKAASGLARLGFEVLLAARLPANDAAVAAGQILEFAHRAPPVRGES
jgi:hydrogenase maturation protein HypF